MAPRNSVMLVLYIYIYIYTHIYIYIQCKHHIVQIVFIGKLKKKKKKKEKPKEGTGIVCSQECLLAMKTLVSLYRQPIGILGLKLGCGNYRLFEARELNYGS